MPKVTFPYIAVPVAANEAQPHGASAQRPLAFATLVAPSGLAVNWIVMLDSGADACVFPLSLAGLLNLDVAKLPRAITTGVGSQSNVTYYGWLSIRMQDGIAFSAYAGFTSGMEAIGVGLLGQSGFFEAHNVEFRHADRVFTVEIIRSGYF